MTNPGPPIARGLDASFVVPQTEMYGEPFVVPEPMETVFISWYDGGEVFRSGLTFQRGAEMVEASMKKDEMPGRRRRRD